MMENVLLIRYGELHLKGLNRPFFERKLIERIKSAHFRNERASAQGAGKDIRLRHRPVHE